ncbi:MAG TPA: hypothetical protein VJ438_04135 [Candidatus Nanoarchaeia archaeon]|nr:hypothetical protein [Candidatus Nanoarchaeia archaeon]
MEKKKLITILVAILIILLVWGLIGGSQAQEIGNTCDIGVGDGHTFCWTWHTNVVGQIQENINDFLNNP